MTSGFFSGDVLRGLTVRVLFLLSLALLPIGLIAVSQTQQIATQNRMNAELSLLAITEQAATAEARILGDAFGAAQALSSIVQLHHGDTASCRAFFKAYLAANPTYGMVGLVEPDGRMTCSSIDAAKDLSNDPHFQNALDDPSIGTQAFQSEQVTGQPVTVITSPVMDGGTLEGLIKISIPADVFRAAAEPELDLSPLALMAFNRSGEIIATEQEMHAVADELPADVALAAFTSEEPTVFQADNARGVSRVYAIRPVVQNAVFAVSVWPSDTPFLNPSILTRLGTMVPIVMWAASLLVAFWALNRLAITHIRKLGRQMRRFAINRDLPRNTLGTGVPTELIEIEATFISMGESILRDEATLEDSLREKNILLKEVHHRVKNNLQLISSIMNMQIRQAHSPDARLSLRRLQERILSLATVHKNLYQTEDLVRVHAPALLHEVVNQLLAVGLATGSNVEVKQEYADLTLEADDAAPLTLLLSEAVTNALKNVDQGGKVRGKIEVTLTEDRANHAKLCVWNSKGTEESEGGTGLGSRLIEAFARQLNGQVEIEDNAESYSLSVTFPVPENPRPQADF